MHRLWEQLLERNESFDDCIRWNGGSKPVDFPSRRLASGDRGASCNRREREGSSLVGNKVQRLFAGGSRLTTGRNTQWLRSNLLLALPWAPIVVFCAPAKYQAAAERGRPVEWGGKRF